MLVHNFRSGSVMEKLGLDYEALEEHYPRLTYAVGSGYGSSGPYVEEIRGIRIDGAGTELRLCWETTARGCCGTTDTAMQKLKYFWQKVL